MNTIRRQGITSYPDKVVVSVYLYDIGRHNAFFTTASTLPCETYNFEVTGDRGPKGIWDVSVVRPLQKLPDMRRSTEVSLISTIRGQLTTILECRVSSFDISYIEEYRE